MSVPVAEPVTGVEVEQEELPDSTLSVTSPQRLIWWRFKKHRLAVASAVAVAGLYLIALFADFVAPQDPNAINPGYRLAPPTPINFLDPDGNFTFWPGVNPVRLERDPNTLRVTYLADTSIWYPI